MIFDFLPSFSLGKYFGSDDKSDGTQQQHRPLAGISLTPVRSGRSSKSLRSSRSRRRFGYGGERHSGSSISVSSIHSGDKRSSSLERHETNSLYKLRTVRSGSQKSDKSSSSRIASPEQAELVPASNASNNERIVTTKATPTGTTTTTTTTTAEPRAPQKSRFSSSGDILDRYGGFVLDPLSYMILQAAKQMHGTNNPTTSIGTVQPPPAAVPTHNKTTSSSNLNTSTHTHTGLSRFPSTAPTIVMTPATETGTNSDAITSSTLTTASVDSNVNRMKPTIGRSSASRGIFGGLFKSSGRPTLHDETDRQSPGDAREEGWNADVVGFVPDAPVKLKYVRVRSHKKYHKNFNHLFLAQELVMKADESWHTRLSSRASIVGDLPLSPATSALRPSSTLDSTNRDAPLDSSIPSSKSAIWCCTFSSDGRYLAVAGEDCIIRVWQVISSPKDRGSTAYSADEDDSGSVRGRKRSKSKRKNMAYAPVFVETAVREFVGHTLDVLDLSWSKNNFLLSSSMDKTVKLWHMNRPHCLGSFLHADFVTSIKFHPQDDRFFLSGSLDCRLRLWSIPDKEVAFMKVAPDLITAVAFSPAGDVAIAGCFGGQCLFFETDQLKLLEQIRVRSSRGRNSKGSRITGIEPINSDHGDHGNHGVKVLISTNDSRIRIYNLYDRSLDTKLKGHENEQGQIRASYSDNGRFVISGSEDERTYIWELPSTGSGGTKERQDYEYFHFNKAPVTCAIFAPTLTKRILSASKDPIYDLCNPPPVKLRPADEGGDSDLALRLTNGDDAMALAEFPPLPPDTQKNRHEDGNIIVTTDRKGFIKVFRQDCAHENRRAYPELVSFIQKKRLSYMGLSPQQSQRTIGAGSIRGRSNASPSLRGSSPRSSVMLDSKLRDIRTPNASQNSLNTKPEAPRRQSSQRQSYNYSQNKAAASGGDVMHCSKCMGTEFKATRSADNKIVLICSACNNAQ